MPLTEADGTVLAGWAMQQGGVPLQDAAKLSKYTSRQVRTALLSNVRP